MPLRVTSTLVLYFFLASSLFAQTRSVPIPPQTQNISGVPIQFRGVAHLTLTPSCNAVNMRLQVGLRDLARKLTAIVKNSGAEQNHSCGDKLRINNVQAWNNNGILEIKINGWAGKEICTGMHIPEFHGLRVRMVYRITSRTTIGSNASVQTGFRVRIVGGKTLQIAKASGPSVRISNDILRGIFNIMNNNGAIDRSLRAGVESALIRRNAKLVLPVQLRSYGLTFNRASIVTSNLGLSLQANGQVPIPPQLRATIAGLMGITNLNCR